MNSIFYFDLADSRFALVIPHIQYIKQKDNQVEIVCNSLSSMPSFGFTCQNSQEALDSWVKICKAVEDYYKDK